jgi:hypothetical protein
MTGAARGPASVRARFLVSFSEPDTFAEEPTGDLLLARPVSA